MWTSGQLLVESRSPPPPPRSKSISPDPTTSGLLEDITECPICNDTFQDPRSLPCIHTYCLRCIQRYADGRKPGTDRIACPLCRREFDIPPAGLGALPKNFFVQKCVETKRLRAGPTSCDVCRKSAATTTTTSRADAAVVALDGAMEPAGVPATMRCVNCHENYCFRCSFSHANMKVTSAHRLLKLGDEAEAAELMATIPAAYCERHGNEETRVYCKDCRTLVCVVCFSELHCGHQCADVHRVAAELRDRMSKDVDGVDDAIGAGRRTLERIDARKREFSENVRLAKTEVSQYAEKLKVVVDAHQKRIVDEISSVESQTNKELDVQRQDVELFLTALESYRKYCDEVRTKGTAYDVARSADALHGRASELMRMKQARKTVLSETVVRFVSSNRLTNGVGNVVGDINVSTKPKTESVTPSAPQQSAKPAKESKPVVDDEADSSILLSSPEMVGCERTRRHSFDQNASHSNDLPLDALYHFLKSKKSTRKQHDVY